MGLFNWLFGVDEPEEENEKEFIKLKEEGKIKPVNFTYKYKKPDVLEVIEGSYDEWEKDLLKEAKLITILGKRRCGKTALCLNVGENITIKKNITMQTIGMDEVEELPEFITNIDDISEVDNNCVLSVGEGAVEGNARRSGSKNNVNLAKLLPIISHKENWILWCSQSGFKTDKITIFEADTLLLMKPSLMQRSGERKAIKELYEKYKPYLDKYEKKIGSHKGLAILYSEKFIGVIRGKLPSFWSEQISKSYRNKEVMT